MATYQSEAPIVAYRSYQLNVNNSSPLPDGFNFPANGIAEISIMAYADTDITLATDPASGVSDYTRTLATQNQITIIAPVATGGSIYLTGNDFIEVNVIVKIRTYI